MKFNNAYGAMNYVDYITNLFETDRKEGQSVRSITFQVTEDCCCACSYCYQIDKHPNNMSLETGKKIVDVIFQMWYDNKDKGFINQKTTKAIILDFIGGEPLMNIDVIDGICTYFEERCIKEHHPWALTWKASIISNGAYYFNPQVEAFLKKFGPKIGMDITIDGPKDVHDKCRIYHNGQGNYDDAKKAFDALSARGTPSGTKVTIAPENLSDIYRIVKYFIDLQASELNINCIFEHKWTYEEGTKLYYELKRIADYLLQNNIDTYVAMFVREFFKPKAEDDITNWCGGAGEMLAFDWKGDAYPCVRYMESSLAGQVEPYILGNLKNGLYVLPEHKKRIEYLDSIDRRTQSTDECFNCPIAEGCSWCSAWNYQENGDPNIRSTNICNAHKARSLANVYYWNKRYPDVQFKMYLPKEEALKFIPEEEYNMLYELQKERG